MNKLKKNKKVTTEDLAVMVAKGFAGVDKRFDGIDERFDTVEKDVRELKKDMGEVKENVKNVRKDILNLGDRFVSYHVFDLLVKRVKLLEEKD